ncbi:hypothetical protein DLAC_09839 [Tieghemostelium lacteum]|uniref:Uncharacterized protein n=1 Tax=Tieghemostelium lacteum TaxID=361077 RepID=A0A151Z7V3_TIELA|nr:hypothetical protein DLAC_09839 [Tieghemostelium lacteum]|eukprot:KYQ89864.1 hypothetical protein DLAC_09839 [Tieghemostelium lacteum]
MKVLSFLLIFVVCLVSCSQDQIQLTNIQLSTNNITWTNPYPSVQFTIGIQASAGVEIQGGTILFIIDPQNVNYVTIAWDYSNVVVDDHQDTLDVVDRMRRLDTTLSGDFTITICVPIGFVEGCGILPSDAYVNCDYSLTATLTNKKVVKIPHSQIISQFPDSAPLAVNQNLVPPVVTEFKITVHPEGPLVTFQLGIEYYGKGLTYFSISYQNATGFPFTAALTEIQMVTNDGYYYVEQLFIPQLYGNKYILTGMYVEDSEGNLLQLSAGQIKYQFNITKIQLPSSSAPVLTGLFTYKTDTNNPHLAPGKNWTDLKASAFLTTPYSPLFCIPNGFSICSTLFVNSTWAIIYSQVFPNFMGNDYNSIEFVSLNEYLESYGYIAIEYQNILANPVLDKVVYSVSTIDALEPFYLELNFTIQLTNSILEILSIDIPESYYLFASDIVSTTSYNLTNVVVGTSILVDSTLQQLTQFTTDILDTKAADKSFTTNGPKTIQRIQVKDLTYVVEFENTVFDLSNYSVATLPFTVYSWTNHSDNVAYSFFFSSNSNLFTNGETNFTSLNTQILSSQYIYTDKQTVETVYQTYVSAYNQYSWGLGAYGDINLQFGIYDSALNYGNNGIISSLCFSILPPTFQPTIITAFDISPSNIIYSNQTSTLDVSIQFKGAAINQLQMIQYQSPFITEFISPLLSVCEVQSYNYQTLISNIQCTIPVSNLPTQTILFYFESIIQGLTVNIPNVQLQESGFPSFIQIIGPEDNGLVPNITQFSTSFNSQTNTITVQYNIENEGNFVSPSTPISFNVFSRQAAQTVQGQQKVLTVTQTSYSGTININLCELQGFDLSYQIIGLFISINSTIDGTFYQFPYQYLTQMDPNQQNFPTNNAICDLSGPRLVDTGILNQDSIYDTSDQSIDITVYYDITDDISGFSSLEGYIRLIGQDTGVNGFYFQPLSFTSQNLVRGNIRNGRYYFNFTLPQNTNGTYQFGIQSITDQVGNTRWLTYQNILILGSSSQVNVYSDYSNPLPQLTSLQLVSNTNGNTFTFSTSGGASSLYLLPLGTNFPASVYATSTGPNTFKISNYNPTNVNSGLYYFGVCLISNSLTTNCYSALELSSLQYPNTFTIFNTLYN